MRNIGTFAGAQVSLDFTDGVRIVLRWRLREGDQLAIAGLGEALGGFSQFSCLGGDCEAEFAYIHELDHRLMELIDLLIAIRYAHPTMVQLPLALSEEEAQELQEILA